MRDLNLDDLKAAARVGGSSTLVERTKLEPAGGEGSAIAPAKYTSGNSSTYVFEVRYIDGEPRNTVLVDSKTSQANRMEDIITRAIKDKQGVLGRMPHIEVVYEQDGVSKVFFDTQLPHRAFDGHIRVGVRDSAADAADAVYANARNSTLDDLSPLFELSPDTWNQVLI